MLNEIINDQITSLRQDVYVKLVDEGLEPGSAAEYSQDFDLFEVLASA